jgi:hypothetical protein
MTPEQVKLQCLSLVVTKAPQDFDALQVIEKAKTLAAFVMQDTPLKRGPGRPPKHSTTEDTD